MAALFLYTWFMFGTDYMNLLFSIVTGGVLYVLVTFLIYFEGKEYFKYFKYPYFALVMFVFIVFMASITTLL